MSKNNLRAEDGGIVVGKGWKLHVGNHLGGTPTPSQLQIHSKSQHAKSISCLTL